MISHCIEKVNWTSKCVLTVISAKSSNFSLLEWRLFNPLSPLAVQLTPKYRLKQRIIARLPAWNIQGPKSLFLTPLSSSTLLYRSDFNEPHLFKPRVELPFPLINHLASLPPNHRILILALINRHYYFPARLLII